MIELRHVTKTYKGPSRASALHDINLTIGQGEFVFITGPSGAGKTTLVRLLFGEEQPTSGDVVVFGKNIKRMNMRRRPKYRRQIGFVFQDFRLIGSMNVFDNIAFALRAVGRPYREIRRRVQAALEVVDLTDKRRSYPSQLSGGEQQRVALARAIVNSPKLIIADEPTGNLDGKLSFDIMRMLDNINATGITVIVVTHADNLISRFGKRTIVLDHGRIVKDIPAETNPVNESECPEGKTIPSEDELTDKNAASRVLTRRTPVPEDKPPREDPPKAGEGNE